MKQNGGKRIPNVYWYLLVMGIFLLGISSMLPLIQSYRIIAQMRMDTWAGMAGDFRARVLFQHGDYRLLEIQPVAEIDTNQLAGTFTGKKEGSFEIWTRPVYISTNFSILNWLAKDTGDQSYVESFNRRMKLQWDEKQTNVTADTESRTSRN
jgi:hypothetical protein